MTAEQQEQPKAEEITLTDEDEAILNQIWDQIAAEDEDDDQ